MKEFSFWFSLSLSERRIVCRCPEGRQTWEVVPVHWSYRYQLRNNLGRVPGQMIQSI